MPSSTASRSVTAIVFLAFSGVGPIIGDGAGSLPRFFHDSRARKPEICRCSLALGDVSRLGRRVREVRDSKTCKKRRPREQDRSAE